MEENLESIGKKIEELKKQQAKLIKKKETF